MDSKSCTLCLVIIIAHLQILEYNNHCFEGEAAWKKFKVKYGKVFYSEGEDQYRKSIFIQNHQYIKLHNMREESFRLKINRFADLSDTEFDRLYKRSRNVAQKSLKPSQFEKSHFHLAAALPKAKDWRGLGAVTQVKFQADCGSCWAFSATGAMEGQLFIRSGKLVTLSEQNLIDCSSEFGNEGCDGGFVEKAFEYVKKNGGLDPESAYPYKAKLQKKCKYDATLAAKFKVTGYVELESGSEVKLEEAVAAIGPISVSIDSSHRSFRFYESGIYYEPLCGNEQSALDHSMLVVGYGVNVRRQEFWIVKNSWGAAWGEEGYIRMTRNWENNCGIASDAMYPLLGKYGPRTIIVQSEKENSLAHVNRINLP